MSTVDHKFDGLIFFFLYKFKPRYIDDVVERQEIGIDNLRAFAAVMAIEPRVAREV